MSKHPIHSTPLNSGNSRSVASSQSTLHPDLEKLVKKYQSTHFNKPIAYHNQQAFELLRERLNQYDAKLIFDSGCGVGDSTHYLAMQYPDHLVIGIDRSEDRLTRQRPPLPSNALLARSDLVDFWRLATSANIQLSHHFLLYPNPYPKANQISRRFYAHPVFPDFVKLGGRIEARSNWKLYLEELQLALHLYGIKSSLEQLHVELPITAFERKYHASGQPLWRLISES